MGNSRHSAEETTEDNCHGCDLMKPEVIIRKNCSDTDCGRCKCRAYWCVACLSRILLAASDDVREKTKCPFCRSNFCVWDVKMLTSE
ncbi:hypothetical protein PMAYCL1PPCAC_00751, partial [Pristionchus mayeri]